MLVGRSKLLALGLFWMFELSVEYQGGIVEFQARQIPWEIVLVDDMYPNIHTKNCTH